MLNPNVHNQFFLNFVTIVYNDQVAIWLMLSSFLNYLASYQYIACY